jgi:ABC-2 type transport system permease protein
VKLRRIGAVARKEFLHIFRDPRSLGMAIAIPMLLLLLFGYALTLDVDNVPMVVWDQSESPLSRELISRFSDSPYFSIRGYVRSYHEIERAIDSGSVLAALIVPRSFASFVGAGRAVSVQFIVDGSDSNTATIATGYAEIIVQTYSLKVTLNQIQRMSGRRLQLPLDLRPRVWFNEDLESKNYIIPGLIAVIMNVIAALLTSLTVAREWETGTMEQLISTPLKARELILGKLLPYFALGMFDVLLAVLMGKFLFRVPLRGNMALVFGMAAVFLAGALAVGMLISIVTRSQLLSSQIAMTVTYLPSLLLSGLMFAIANMPKPLQMVTYLIPARYFVKLLKSIYLKGVGLETLMIEAALLSVFGAVTVALANVKFKKKLVK